MFVLARLQERGPQPQKMSWVLVQVKAASAARKLSTLDNWRRDQRCLFRQEIIGESTTTPKNCHGLHFG
jgi:hypothetical protein